MLIGYARISTIDQNPELQTDALRAAGCMWIFTEKALGSRKDRPQLEAALDYMRKGDTLIVWKLSRLAMSLKQILETAHNLEKRGIDLKVLTQNIDTSTQEGRLFFHMTAAFIEFQRELIAENMQAGRNTARMIGRKGGRPPRMTKEKIRTAEALLKDTRNYPFVSDIIKQLNIGRTTFYRHFTQERLFKLRGDE